MQWYKTGSRQITNMAALLRWNDNKLFNLLILIVPYLRKTSAYEKIFQFLKIVFLLPETNYILHFMVQICQRAVAEYCIFCPLALGSQLIDRSRIVLRLGLVLGLCMLYKIGLLFKAISFILVVLPNSKSVPLDLRICAS